MIVYSGMNKFRQWTHQHGERWALCTSHGEWRCYDMDTGYGPNYLDEGLAVAWVCNQYETGIE